MKVGFIVDGRSDKIVVESDGFAAWLRGRGMRRGDPVVAAGGQVGSARIGRLATLLRKQIGDVDRIVQLTDLDPNEAVPCISARRAFAHSQEVDLVVVAKKAMESWFLADSLAMRNWSGDADFFEEYPEETPGMPWDRLKEVGTSGGRGPGSKVGFAKKIVRTHGFSIASAAKHPNCPSAKYFVHRVGALGGGR